MQYCTRCKIKVRGNKTSCPLCDGPLKGEPTMQVFPVLEKKNMNAVSVLKVSLFLYLSFLVVMGAIAYLFGYSPWMFLAFVLSSMGLVNIWLVIMHHNNPIKMYHIQLYVSMVLSLSFIRRISILRFLVIWIYPLLFVSLIVVTLIVARFLKYTIEDYVIYFMTATLFSFLQLLFIATGLNTFPLIAILCICAMLIFSIGVGIFRFRELQNAAKKYLNL